MNRRTVKEFLQTITNDELVDQGTWVMTKCPMAFYTHAEGTDNSPSFGISVSGDSESVYYCFSCSEKVRSLLWLIQNLWLMSGEYPLDAAKVYMSGKTMETQRVTVGYKDVWKDKKVIIPKAIPDDVLENFPVVSEDDNYINYKVKKYLVGRGIPFSTQLYFGVRYCEERKSMLFPYTLADGKVYSLQQRQVDVKMIYFTTPKMVQRTDLIFSTIKESGAWFGLDKADVKKPVTIVEGAIDAMRLYSLGVKNVIASCNANVTKKQFTMLTFPKIYLGYDMDKAGMKARRIVIKQLLGTVQLIDLDWNFAKKVTGELCEDPGDLPNAVELLKVIKNPIIVHE